MIDVVIIHMEAIHTGMMSFVGITIDLATKNFCSNPTISYGLPSAGSQPMQYLYFTGWWYGNYLPNSDIYRIPTLLYIGGASDNSSDWFTVICHFTISRMHLGSLFPGSVCLLLLHCWQSQIFG